VNLGFLAILNKRWFFSVAGKFGGSATIPTKTVITLSLPDDARCSWQLARLSGPASGDS